MSFYAADGSINLTVVDSSNNRGVYAADGSINVVVATASTKGAYHPTGAWWVTLNNSANSRRAADGSLNVRQSGSGMGQRITVVSGSLSGGGPGGVGSPIGLLLLLTKVS